MFARLRVPWPQMLLLALTVAALVRLSVALHVVAIVAVVWMATLWLDWVRPDRPALPFAIPARPDPDAVARAAMAAAIDQVEVPLLLVHGHNILVANGAAQSALGPYVVGQDARIALRHPDAVALLGQAAGGSTTIRGLTGARSLWQMTRRRIASGAENIASGAQNIASGAQNIASAAKNNASGVEDNASGAANRTIGTGDDTADYWMIELRDRNAEADIGRAHTDFVANASHELRTPLSSIIGYAETLAEAPGKLDPGITSRFSGIILREAQRMQNLVADLMSLSQLEAEKHDAPTDRIAIHAVASRVVNEFAYGDAGARVVLDAGNPGDAAIGVTGDTRQLEQLLRNLIDNALKYGDAARPVEVGIAADHRGYALLTVTDHGAGIAADHLPHLTRRFYRADPGRSRAAGGTGLGLAIVKHVVERHRGKLDIASIIGEGTKVSVRLPMTDAAGPTVP